MIAVNSNGIPTGKIVSRKLAHSSPGVKHLAIQVLLFNNKKQLILHKRSSKKIGGGTYDTPVTHILKGETRNKATRRALKAEYGVSEKVSLKWFGSFSYKEDYGDGTCENEFGFVSVTVYDGEILPNLQEMESKLVFKKLEEIFEDLQKDPSKYPIWFKYALRAFKESVLFKKFL